MNTPTQPKPFAHQEHSDQPHINPFENVAHVSADRTVTTRGMKNDNDAVIQPTYAIAIALCFSTTMLPSISGASDAISFDLPPTAVAIPVSDPALNAGLSGGSEPVEVTLRLSSMIGGASVPEIDRWMIRCVPREGAWRVADYSPRTETGSDLAGPIEVKSADEKSQSVGMAADVSHPPFGRGHLGIDRGSKKSESLQYARNAPLHAVTASGTIERGRGVYFKMRWTSTQVLEGEKRLSITFNVPVGFRTGLLDVSVVAIGRPAKSKGMADAFSQIPMLGEQPALRPIGEARFVVAVHAEGDPDARLAAAELAEAEATLRRGARSARAGTGAGAGRSFSNLFAHVAAKLDVDSVDLHSDWAERVIFEDADPYVDPVIKKLPTHLRVAVLDYCDARRHFETLRTRSGLSRGAAANATAAFQLDDFVKASIENATSR